MSSSRAGSRLIWVVLVIVALIGTWMVVSAYLRAPTPPPEPARAAPSTASSATTAARNTTAPSSATTSATTPSVSAPATTPTSPASEPHLAASPPTRVVIPAVGIDAPTGSVGVDQSGVLEVPPLSEPGLTAWYRLGVTPGELGNALIVGHVDTRTGPAVFYRLGAVKPGDQVRVTRQDATVAVFRVDTVTLYDKNDLPLEELYGPSTTARLQLVTCGGPLDNGHHVGNVVVSASLQAQS